MTVQRETHSLMVTVKFKALVQNKWQKPIPPKRECYLCVYGGGEGEGEGGGRRECGLSEPYYTHAAMS